MSKRFVGSRQTTLGREIELNGIGMALNNALLAAVLSFDTGVAHATYTTHVRAGTATGHRESSNSANKGGVKATMQVDGNLVIYTNNETPIWSSAGRARPRSQS